MKRVILYVKKLLAFILFLFFAFIAFDWIVLKGSSILLGWNHEGVFFQEVWSFMRNIFTWTDGYLRAILRILAIGVMLCLYFCLFRPVFIIFGAIFCLEIWKNRYIVCVCKMYRGVGIIISHFLLEIRYILVK